MGSPVQGRCRSLLLALCLLQVGSQSAAAAQLAGAWQAPAEALPSPPSPPLGGVHLLPQPQPASIPAAPATETPCSLLSVLLAEHNASFFVQALSAAGLSRVLDDPLLDATVFVPVDAAWLALLTALQQSRAWLLADANRGALRTVLEYHIVPGVALPLDELAVQPYLARLPTLMDQPLFVAGLSGDSAVGEAQVLLAATSRQVARVARGDLPSCSGHAVAHLVDAVLSPDPSWQDDGSAPALQAPAGSVPLPELTLVSGGIGTSAPPAPESSAPPAAEASAQPATMPAAGAGASPPSGKASMPSPPSAEPAAQPAVAGAAAAPAAEPAAEPLAPEVAPAAAISPSPFPQVLLLPLSPSPYVTLIPLIPPAAVPTPATAGAPAAMPADGGTAATAVDAGTGSTGLAASDSQGALAPASGQAAPVPGGGLVLQELLRAG